MFHIQKLLNKLAHISEAGSRNESRLFCIIKIELEKKYNNKRWSTTIANPEGKHMTDKRLRA